MPSYDIPISKPLVAGREREYINRVLDSTQFSMGAFVGQFERAWAEYCGVRHALMCSNGTAALHLALLALGVRPGDEVIVPTLTFVATANAVTYCGATPIFVDSDPHTWNIDPAKVEEAITPRTVGIIGVHLYGQPCDMTTLRQIANRHGLWLVEDAAQAHGASISYRVMNEAQQIVGHTTHKVGSLGDMATFSFYGNKIITCGEGGAVTTNDDRLARRVVLYRGQGMDPDKRYWHTVVGHNYRMTDLQAAVGLAQLEMIDTILDVRASVYGKLDARLIYIPDNNRGIVRRGAVSRYAGTVGMIEPVHWIYPCLLPLSVNRDAVIGKMTERGIETRPVFYPIHTLPPYRTGQSLPIAEDIARRGICLPLWHLSDKQIERVAQTLQEIISDYDNAPSDPSLDTTPTQQLIELVGVGSTYGTVLPDFNPRSFLPQFQTTVPFTPQ